jgi:DNA invertase Pin-like site-specific DNA recombinase
MGKAVTSVRCAIYTRKSSEEGLEQSFNSLHAQREACEAFISSQRHEGWSVVAAQYNDGGFSGGSMDRPALTRLLADIAAGNVDIVVVYKIDRLTRSLFDFAKIVETFDAHAVSFVSVTQAFNTTTSMGRLTLNVLLSFAQFEREVTGERIRDKIAASKRRGMWMGGNIPLGYDLQDRKLVVNAKEAKTVEAIFRLYAELGAVGEVKAEVDRLGLRTKVHTWIRGHQRWAAVQVRHLYAIQEPPVSGRDRTRARSTRAITRQSSIRLSGIWYRHSSPQTPACAGRANLQRTRVCSLDCCSMAGASE